MTPHKITCVGCGAEFNTPRLGKKYCSQRCRNNSDRRKHYKKHKEKCLAYSRKYQAEHKERRAEKSRLYYNAHKEQYRASARKSYAAHKEQAKQRSDAKRVAFREWVENIKASSGCSNCGEARPVCLDFHHVDSTQKEHNIGTMISNQRPKNLILREIEKCIVLCKNCHAVEHRESSV